MLVAATWRLPGQQPRAWTQRGATSGQCSSGAATWRPWSSDRSAREREPGRCCRFARSAQVGRAPRPWLARAALERRRRSGCARWRMRPACQARWNGALFRQRQRRRWAELHGGARRPVAREVRRRHRRSQTIIRRGSFVPLAALVSADADLSDAHAIARARARTVARPNRAGSGHHRTRHDAAYRSLPGDGVATCPSPAVTRARRLPPSVPSGRRASQRGGHRSSAMTWWPGLCPGGVRCGRSVEGAELHCHGRQNSTSHEAESADLVAARQDRRSLPPVARLTESSFSAHRSDQRREVADRRRGGRPGSATPARPAPSARDEPQRRRYSR